LSDPLDAPPWVSPMVGGLVRGLGLASGP